MFSDNSDLASVSTLEEHRFISKHLNMIDPQHRRWYISTRQEDQNRHVVHIQLTEMDPNCKQTAVIFIKM